MSLIKKLKYQDHKLDRIVDLSKIFIIIFISVYLIGNFIPFYEGFDAYIFGITAINLSEGSFSITNELLKETGEWTFVPRHWSKTISNDSMELTIEIRLTDRDTSFIDELANNEKIIRATLISYEQEYSAT